MTTFDTESAYTDALDDLRAIPGGGKFCETLVIAAFRGCDFWRLLRLMEAEGLARKGVSARLRRQFADEGQTVANITARALEGIASA